MKKSRYVYALILLPFLWYILFCYRPMYGILLAFKDYYANKGIVRSPWIGFAHFEYIFIEKAFWRSFRNTLFISFGNIVTGFAPPIILAIFLNELRLRSVKRTFQTIYTFPHFLSWVVVGGIVKNFFNSTGALNNLISILGGEPLLFLAKQELFRGLLYFMNIWKGAGWGSIIYLATIASINPEIYEAAIIDGTSRIQRILYITWPSIRSMAILLLILAVGNVMNAGFDQVYNLYNPLVYKTGDIIDTYIFRTTFEVAPDFGRSTAIGLFKSVTNFILLIAADRTAKALGERGLF